MMSKLGNVLSWLMLIGFIVTLLYFGVYSGVEKCNHCGYTTYLVGKADGCKVPGCDQKTSHKDQR